MRFDQALSYDLPYPAAHFDRVVSSLFFHHLSWEDKERTAMITISAFKWVPDFGHADGNLQVVDVEDHFALPNGKNASAGWR